MRTALSPKACGVYTRRSGTNQTQSYHTGALRRVLGGLEAIGHVWTSQAWEAALYIEWVKRRRGTPKAAHSLTLTALCGAAP